MDSEPLLRLPAQNRVGSNCPLCGIKYGKVPMRHEKPARHDQHVVSRTQHNFEFLSVPGHSSLLLSPPFSQIQMERQLF